MTEVEVGRTCPTCNVSKPQDAYYRNCSECRECKKARSRNARLLQARKLAAFERFVGLLFDLSVRSAGAGAGRAAR